MSAPARAARPAETLWVEPPDGTGPRLALRRRGEGPPVLFVHGATLGAALHDVPGASWLEATARARCAAYAVDLRGYGRSRPAATQARDGPLCTPEEAARDVEAVVSAICAAHAASSLRLVGGSWGSILAARHAARDPRVARLVLHAPIWGARNEAWLDLLADPADRARPAPWGPCRLVTEAELRARWDAEIPPGADWRREATFRALVNETLAEDPDAAPHDPPAFRAPNGCFLDLWEAFSGRPVHDPSTIACPTLLIRGGADATSTRADALALLDALPAPERTYVEIANGGHFISAERRAPQLHAATNAFLAVG